MRPVEQGACGVGFRPSREEVVQFLLTGQVFSIFIITVAAAEIALGLAIVIAIYRNRQSVFVTEVSEMRK